MTTKKIGKKAEYEARKILEQHKDIKIVIKSEVASFYKGSMKDKGAVDLIAIESGTGYQIKTTAKPVYYFKNEEVEALLKWKEKHHLNVKYAIKFRRGKGKKSEWFYTDVSENLKDKRLIMIDKEGAVYYSLVKVKKRKGN